MKIAPVADVKARLSAYLNEAERRGPVVITKNGRAVALLVAPVDEDDLERLVLARSRKFQRILARSRRQIAEGKVISHDEFWKRLAAEKRRR